MGEGGGWQKRLGGQPGHPGPSPLRALIVLPTVFCHRAYLLDQGRSTHNSTDPPSFLLYDGDSRAQEGAAQVSAFKADGRKFSLRYLPSFDLHLFCPRFGVRALPKRQMVLKLKEIFQYTHQSKGAEPKHKVTSSQPVSRCSQAKKVLRAPKSAVASSTPCKQLSETAEPLQGGRNGKGLSRAGAGGPSQEAEVHGLQCGSGQPKGAALTEIDADGPPLTASQESIESSVSGSDASLLSQR